jgi:hypothetical protein
MKILQLTRTPLFAYDPDIKTMRRATKSDLTEAPDKMRRRLLLRFHILIDKKLKEELSSRQAAELRQIQETLQSLEDVETSEIMRAYEERHGMMMQKLSELTAELRKMSAGSQSQSQVPQSKAR